jgi:uncharacterized protein YheU (UPF0270 family)
MSIAVILFSVSPVSAEVPQTVTVQGTLEASGGASVQGTHLYYIAFYTDAVGGTGLAQATGSVSVSEAGRFSFEYAVPEVVLSATQVWYELAIDVSDDGLGTNDLFRERVRIHSVPFALQSADSKSLGGIPAEDYAGAGHSHNLQDLDGAVTDDQVPDDITVERAESAGSADTALALSGMLNDPGDRIPLAEDIFLQVGMDGVVEILAGGERLRLARLKWFDPKNLDDNISPDGQAAANAQVALNSGGEAVLVWSQSDGSNDQIFRSEYRDGSWSDPSSLSDNISLITQDAVSPQVALNDNGESVIVWRQSDGANEQVFRSEYRDGAWSDPASLMGNISPDGTDVSIFGLPQVALNNQGEAVIVWAQSDGSNDQIFRSEYRGGAWSDPGGLSVNISPNGEDATSPQVSMNDEGEAIIVWSQSDGSNAQIFRSEYRNGSWSDPSSLTDNFSPNGEDAQSPNVTLNDNGDAVIVWRQSDGANDQLFRSEYFNNSWADPADLSDNFTPGGQNATMHDLALNDSGEAVIVWEQSDGTNLQTFRSERREDSWVDPEDLGQSFSFDGEDARNPKVAIDNTGEAIVVWRQLDPDAGLSIFRSEYREGSWKDPLNLSDNISPDVGFSQFATVAMNDNGEAVIVWRHSGGGTDTYIFRSEYRFGF